MRPVTPYSKYLADREPIAAMREASEKLAAITGSWSEKDYARASAPGKWTARQLLIHLAHVEIAFATRARMALSTPGYVVQPFDQDRWMEHEVSVSGKDAADAFLALSRMNTALFSSLSEAELATRISHPERGEITVEWLLHTLAGHQVSHLRQIEEIAGRGAAGG